MSESTCDGESGQEKIPKRGSYPSTWPTAQIESLAVVRVACLMEIEDGDHERDEDSTFELYCFPGTSDGKLVFIGELAVTDGSYHAKATVQCGVRFKTLNGTLEDETVVNRYGKRYGEWVSHLLWDHGSAALRAVVAITPFADIVVPVTTPSFEIRRLPKLTPGS